MTTQPLTMPSNENNVLFDDRSLLEVAFGKTAFMLSSANANCDCISHVSTEDDEDAHTHPVATVAG